MAKKKPTKKKKNLTSAPKPTKARREVSNWMTNSLLHYFIIGGFAFALYANTLKHDFCQDDAIVITHNMYTKKGVEGIPGILNKDTFFGFFKKEGKDKLVAGGRYRPLTLVLFALEWELFSKETKDGTTASPFGFHLVNVLLFVLLGLMLYKVTITLLAYYQAQEAKLLSFMAALIFVAHPVHTEVVANIKGADEIVALLGSLATLYFLLKAYRSGKIWMLIVGLIIFALTIFSKENTITFLAIIPAALYLFGDRQIGIPKDKRIRFWASNSLLLLSIIPFLMKRSKVLFDARFQLMGPSVSGGELMNYPFQKYEHNILVPFSFGEKFSTIFYTLGEYLRLLFAPFKLTSDYYPHHIERMQFGDWQVILSIILYLGLAVLAAKSLRKNPMVSLGIIIYFASLSIVSNFFFEVGTFMAERFLFMPSVGFSLAVGAGLVAFFRKGKNTIALGALGLLVLLFSVRTVLRNPAWKNDETLFLTDVKNSPNSAKIRNAAGGATLAQAGKIADKGLKKQKAKQALEHIKVALKEHPRYANAWLLQGNAYNILEQYDSAIQSYKNALKLKPNFPDALKNLGITYEIAGNYFGKVKGDAGKAITYLTEAIKYNPKQAETHRLLGIAHAINGQPAQGIPHLEKAFALSPTANIALDISLAYRQIGNKEKAVFYEQKALKIDPESLRKRTGK